MTYTGNKTEEITFFTPEESMPLSREERERLTTVVASINRQLLDHDVEKALSVQLDISPRLLTRIRPALKDAGWTIEKESGNLTGWLIASIKHKKTTRG